MTTTTILVDGMLSGTGIRNAIEGGYIDPADLGLAPALVDALRRWVDRYGRLHMEGYGDADAMAALDAEGLALAKRVAAERPDQVVGYYSDALMRRLDSLPHV